MLRHFTVIFPAAMSSKFWATALTFVAWTIGFAAGRSAAGQTLSSVR
jgi:hypothetical protein